MSDETAGVGASSARVRERVLAWIGDSDARLLFVFAAGIYALFTLASLLLGLDLGGTVNTLRRITFLSAVYGILVLALNLQWGYAGLFNIGVAGFMAVGVYTMAMLSTAPTETFPGLGLPLPIGIVGGVLAAALLGAVAALPALRLRGDYLAIVTLAFAEIVRLTYRSPVFQEFSVGGIQLGTGGSRGMSLPTDPVQVLFYDVLGIRDSIVVGWAYALLLVVVVGLTYWLLTRIGYSPFGRVLKAIREDEIVARALGKDTRTFKIKAFALGCGLMGLGAILWRLSGGYVATSMFQPIHTFYVFVALIIGGAGSSTGSVVGGAVFASLLFEGPNFVRRIVSNFVDVGRAPNTLTEAVGALGGLDPGPLLNYTLSDVNLAALRLVLLGVVLVYLIQNRPQGLLGHRKEVASTIDLGVRESGERVPGEGEQ